MLLMTSVLCVVTGADTWTLANGTQHPTGYWAEELLTPHQVFRDAGFDITFATPGGGAPTVDQASLAPETNGGDESEVAAMRDYLDHIKGELSSATALEQVDPDSHDLVFVPGGHGPMEDLAVSPDLGRILSRLLDSGKIVSALCHAPTALLSARREDGSWAFRRVPAHRSHQLRGIPGGIRRQGGVAAGGPARSTRADASNRASRGASTSSATAPCTPGRTRRRPPELARRVVAAANHHS
jgi:putative intracellular protease/amidase